MRSTIGKSSRLLASMLLCVVLLGGVAGCGSSADDGVAARYGDMVITEQEVTDYTANFRSVNGLEADEDWAQYLYEQGLTASTWRESAIGALVEDALVADRAVELGIAADEGQVESQISEMKESLGIDSEEAWADYLEGIGTTPEAYRADLEKASVSYQLFSREIELDPLSDVAVLDSYINDELADRIVWRYSVLCYDTEEAAQAALDQLSDLAPDELREGFSALLENDDSDDTTAENGGDIGWDIANSWGALQSELQEELLDNGALSATVHEYEGKYYVVIVSDRFVFGKQASYDNVPAGELKEYVRNAATYANWSQLTSDYIAGLRDAADVQVREMPKGLPYDVDTLLGQ